MLSLLLALQLVASGPSIEVATDDAEPSETLVACGYASGPKMFKNCILIDDGDTRSERKTRALDAVDAIRIFPGGHHIGVLEQRGIDPDKAVAVVRVRFVPKEPSFLVRVEARRGAPVLAWLRSIGFGEEFDEVDENLWWRGSLKRDQLIELLTKFQDVTVRSP